MSEVHKDYYFAKKHIFIKIWQTVVAFLCWILMLIPCVVTISSYLAYLTRQTKGFYFWHYLEGFRELSLLLIFLLFVSGMMAVFCLTVSFIQNQRRNNLTEKWPMYDMKKSNLNQRKVNILATRKFGTVSFRQNIPFYVVKAKQNFAKNELKKRVF